MQKLCDKFAFLTNKPFLAFLVIVGTVVGSGFLSGKEIVVFFSRFGRASFLFVFVAFFLFWGLFYFFLRFGAKAMERLRASKFALLLNTLICLILTSAMVAGIFSLLESLALILRIAVMGGVLLLAILVCLRGSGTLEKLNLLLVPVMIVFTLLNLVNLFVFKTGIFFQGGFAGLGIFYSILYVLLNTSNSAIVIAGYSNKLTDKQKVQVSFAAALALFLILLFANIVLLQNSYTFPYDMPLLKLVQGWHRGVMSIIILFGCSTTLFSLVCSETSTLKSISGNSFLLILISVLLPFALSFCGFGFIVSVFYPLSSILGLFLLCDLFLWPVLKSKIGRKAKK